MAEKAASEVLSLPMHPWLAEEEQTKVVKALTKVARYPEGGTR